MSFLFSSNNTYAENQLLIDENEELIDENQKLKQHLKEMENMIQKLIDKNNVLELKKETQIETNTDDHIFLGKFLYKREDNVMLYASDSRRLIPNVIPWQYNRRLDENHVENLKNIILKKKSFEGNIDILKFNDELCIVNGQHRIEALQRIMEKDEHLNFTMELIVNVHEVTSFDSSEANDIFNATNNTKNVEMRDRPDIKLQNICNRLIDKFPKGIKNNPTGKATLHRMDKKQIYNLIQYNDSFNDENKSEDYLFNKIVELNTKLSNQSFEELFNTKHTSKQRRKLYDGAIKDGFYLGLKTNEQLAFLFQKYV